MTKGWLLAVVDSLNGVKVSFLCYIFRLVNFDKSTLHKSVVVLPYALVLRCLPAVVDSFCVATTYFAEKLVGCIEWLRGENQT